jgi:hypothetical protein
MLHLTNERLLTVAQAARLVPGRSGRGIGVATMWRWMTRGFRGAVLESVRIGGIR